MKTYTAIQKDKPLGSDSYFIDFNNEVVYLKDGGSKVYSPYIGWEEADLDYIKKFEIFTF